MSDTQEFLTSFYNKLIELMIVKRPVIYSFISQIVVMSAAVCNNSHVLIFCSIELNLINKNIQTWIMFENQQTMWCYIQGRNKHNYETYVKLTTFQIFI